MHQLTLKQVTQKIQNLEFGISGDLEVRAANIMEAKSKQGQDFRLYPLNVGNPLELGQPAITFAREVIVATLLPTIHDSPFLSEDAKKRSLYYQSHFSYPSQIGAYSDNQGYEFVRKSVATYITKRDEAPCSPNSIFLTEGGSLAIDYLCKLFLENESDCILLPRPEFPTYSAMAKLAGGASLFYDLEEDCGWSISVSDLENVWANAQKNGQKIKVLVAINPGNPTGQVLSKQAMEGIVKFCNDKDITLFADEVYQKNIYSSKWVSFYQVLYGMSKDIYDNTKIISLNSISKGWLGECGMRGAYLHVHNVDDDVKSKLLTLTALYGINSVGQLFVEVMCNPPEDGRESAEVCLKFKNEVNSISESLNNRRLLLINTLNSMKNVKCTNIEGAFYAFPRIFMTESVLKEASNLSVEPDALYCQQCLEYTGIMIVPGCKFGQKKGTYHFRITNLIFDMTKFEDVMSKLKAFNEKFFEKYEK